MTTNERGDMDHLLERLEHQESMLRRDPSRHHLHAADTMRDARREVIRLREVEDRARNAGFVEASRLWGVEREKLLAALTRLRERERRLEGALRRAEQFIANGIEFGFIRMPDPDTPDPAHEALLAIRAAIKATAAPAAEREG